MAGVTVEKPEASAKQRVGEDTQSVELEQHRGVAQEAQERLASAHHPSLRPQEDGGCRTVGPLRSVAAFYALQFHLLRRWSGGGPAVLRRGVETVAVSALSLVAMAWLIPGISVRDLPSAILL